MLRRLTPGDPLKLPRAVLAGLLGAMAGWFYALRSGLWFAAFPAAAARATPTAADSAQARAAIVALVLVAALAGLVIGWHTPLRRAAWHPPPRPGD